MNFEPGQIVVLNRDIKVQLDNNLPADTYWKDTSMRFIRHLDDKWSEVWVDAFTRRPVETVALDPAPAES